MKLVKLLHKWLSVFVALQLMIWLGSGLFFNLMDHDKARGNEFRIKAVNTVKLDTERLLEPSAILKQQLKPVTSIKQVLLLDQPFYLLNHHLGLYEHFYNEHALVNAYTGDVKKIDKEMAEALANSTYSGATLISSIIKASPPLDDFPKEVNPVWRINYSDHINTSIYIDANSGRLVGHSNDDKRFADFFFMLHFMDYGTVGGFNNWQIIFFALFTLVFCLTGFLWVIELVRKGRYRLV
jgi:hypothetical protein